MVALQTLDAADAADADLVDVTVKASFRSLGRRFGKQTPAVAAAIVAADAAVLAGRLRADGRASVDVESMGSVELGPDDVVVTETPREGWAVAHDAGESVALDLTITPQLRRLGLARDVVRLVQEARKSSGLQVSDRVRLWWQSADENVVAALREHAALVGEEVLAPDVTEGPPALDLPAHDQVEPALTFWIQRA